MNRDKFGGMKYPIHNLPLEVNLFKEFPELSKIPGLRTKAADNNKVLRYGFYLYDPKSDLLRDIPNLKDRKEQAAVLAGYKKVEGVWEQEALEVITRANTDVHEVMFVVITSVFHDRKFREYHTLFQELNEYTKLRWTPVGKDESLDDAKKKTHLREQCSAIQDSLDAYDKVLWGDDDGMRKYVEEILMTTPEKIAKAYAKDYEEETETNNNG